MFKFIKVASCLGVCFVMFNFNRLAIASPQQFESFRPSLPKPKLAKPVHCSSSFADAIKFRQALLRRDPSQRTKSLSFFLKSPDDLFKIAAAQAMGDMESPSALVPLRQQLNIEQKQLAIARKKTSLKRRSDIDVEDRFYTAMRVAIARIETRNLHGVMRLNAISKKIGLTLPVLKGLFSKLNYPYLSGMDKGTVQLVTIPSIIETLVIMAQKGDDVSAILSTWSLLPQQKVRIKAASMPESKRVDTVLNYLSTIRALTFDDTELAQRYLPRMPYARAKIAQKLLDMCNRSQLYSKRANGYRGGFYAIFFAASMTKNMKMAPVLRKFIMGRPGVNNKFIKAQASIALTILEHETYIYVGNVPFILRK